jgi:hypothetical protein
MFLRDIVLEYKYDPNQATEKPTMLGNDEIARQGAIKQARAYGSDPELKGEFENDKNILADNMSKDFGIQKELAFKILGDVWKDKSWRVKEKQNIQSFAKRSQSKFRNGPAMKLRIWFRDNPNVSSRELAQKAGEIGYSKQQANVMWRDSKDTRSDAHQINQFMIRWKIKHPEATRMEFMDKAINYGINKKTAGTLYNAAREYMFHKNIKSSEDAQDIKFAEITSSGTAGRGKNKWAEFRGWLKQHPNARRDEAIDFAKSIGYKDGEMKYNRIKKGKRIFNPNSTRGEANNWLISNPKLREKLSGIYNNSISKKDLSSVMNAYLDYYEEEGGGSRNARQAWYDIKDYVILNGPRKPFMESQQFTFLNYLML